MKAHLKMSDVPLKEGDEIEALCGKTVKSAAFLFWIEGYVPSKLTVSELLVCKRCFKAEPETLKVYVYAIVNGQDSKTGEALNQGEALNE